jgi:hypothetical protein
MVIPIDRVASPCSVTDISTPALARVGQTFNAISQIKAARFGARRAPCLRGESLLAKPNEGRPRLVPHLGTYAPAAEEFRSDIALHMFGLDNQATSGLA